MRAPPLSVVVLFGAVLGIMLGLLAGVAENTREAKHTLRRIEQQLHAQSCTHGESSIVATMKNGKLHVSKPVVTGCLP